MAMSFPVTVPQCQGNSADTQIRLRYEDARSKYRRQPHAEQEGPTFRQGNRHVGQIRGIRSVFRNPHAPVAPPGAAPLAAMHSGLPDRARALDATTGIGPWVGTRFSARAYLTATCVRN